MLCVLLLGTICACSVHCMRPVIRVPRDAEKTGRYIAVLRQDTCHARLLEIVELLENSSEGCVVYGYMEVAIKAIILDLTYDALQMVGLGSVLPGRPRVAIIIAKATVKIQYWLTIPLDMSIKA